MEHVPSMADACEPEPLLPAAEVAAAAVCAAPKGVRPMRLLMLHPDCTGDESCARCSLQVAVAKVFKKREFKKTKAVQSAGEELEKTAGETSVGEALVRLEKVQARESGDVYLCLCGLPSATSDEADSGAATATATAAGLEAGDRAKHLADFFARHLAERAGGGGHARCAAGGGSHRAVPKAVFACDRKRKIELLRHNTHCTDAEAEAALRACDGDHRRALIHLRLGGAESSEESTAMELAEESGACVRIHGRC